MSQGSEPVHLISKWTLVRGCDQEAIAALKQLAVDVLASEPSTLVYTVHTPAADAPDLTSLPPSRPQEVSFYEVYESAEAFRRHVSGPVFQRFVAEHGHLFLSAPPLKLGVEAAPQPFVRVEFLDLQAGFFRSAAPVVGVAHYRITPGELLGSWTADTPSLKGKTGIERARKEDGAPGELPGRYHVQIWRSGQPMEAPPLFDGALVIAALDSGADLQVESYRLQWTKPGSAEAYAGLGLRPAGSDQLSVSYWSAPLPA